MFVPGIGYVPDVTDFRPAPTARAPGVSPPKRRRSLVTPPTQPDQDAMASLIGLVSPGASKALPGDGSAYSSQISDEHGGMKPPQGLVTAPSPELDQPRTGLSRFFNSNLPESQRWMLVGSMLRDISGNLGGDASNQVGPMSASFEQQAKANADEAQRQAMASRIFPDDQLAQQVYAQDPRFAQGALTERYAPYSINRGQTHVYGPHGATGVPDPYSVGEYNAYGQQTTTDANGKLSYVPGSDIPISAQQQNEMNYRDNASKNEAARMALANKEFDLNANTVMPVAQTPDRRMVYAGKTGNEVVGSTPIDSGASRFGHAGSVWDSKVALLRQANPTWSEAQIAQEALSTNNLTGPALAAKKLGVLAALLNSDPTSSDPARRAAIQAQVDAAFQDGGGTGVPPPTGPGANVPIQGKPHGTPSGRWPKDPDITWARAHPEDRPRFEAQFGPLSQYVMSTDPH